MRARPTMPADAAAIIALIRAAFAVQSVPTDPPSGALRETTETIAAAIVAGGGAVVTQGGAIIGSVLWEEKDGGLYFGRLAVHPAQRRRGIARALVNAAEAEARRRGLPRVHLSTRLPLLDNRRLFAKCGFVETVLNTHAGYSTPTSMVMEKWLGR